MQRLGTLIAITLIAVGGVAVGSFWLVAGSRDRQRTTILLLGLDRRDDEPVELSRSDVMIIASLNPAARSIALVSLPRDLWVQIPGEGEQRLNVAHRLGGPALAIRTVEENFGVRIDHVARTDFRGFERIVDTLGGIEVDVPSAIHDQFDPGDHSGEIPISIPQGRQRLDGRTALQYVRSRHADGDFGRAGRQQQVLQAIRERAMQLDMLPRLPEVARLVRENVASDLTVADQLRLLRVAMLVDRQAVRTLVIDTRYSKPYITPGGADVLLPDVPAIRTAIAQFVDGDRKGDPPAAGAAEAPAPAPTPRSDGTAPGGPAVSDGDAQPARPRLTGWRLLDSTAGPGESVRLEYAITNPGDEPIAVTLGGSIRPSDQRRWIDDPANDVTVTVLPGTVTFSRMFTLGDELPPSAYDVAWGLLSADMRTRYGMQVQREVLTITPKSEHADGPVQPIAGENGPGDAVRRYYAAIDAGDFTSAWELLSPGRQRALQQEQWRHGYRTTQSVQTPTIEVVDRTDERADVAVTIVAVDQAAGSERLTTLFVGHWTVVLVQGAWRLDAASIAQTR